MHSHRLVLLVLPLGCVIENEVIFYFGFKLVSVRFKAVLTR